MWIACLLCCYLRRITRWVRCGDLAGVLLSDALAALPLLGGGDLIGVVFFAGAFPLDVARAGIFGTSALGVATAFPFTSFTASFFLTALRPRTVENNRNPFA